MFIIVLKTKSVTICFASWSLCTAMWPSLSRCLSAGHCMVPESATERKDIGGREPCQRRPMTILVPGWDKQQQRTMLAATNDKAEGQQQKKARPIEAGEDATINI